MNPRTYHFTFHIPACMPSVVAEEIEAAEDSRAMPLPHIEAECRRLGVEARLYDASGYAGRVESDGNPILE